MDRGVDTPQTLILSQCEVMISHVCVLFQVHGPAISGLSVVSCSHINMKFILLCTDPLLGRDLETNNEYSHCYAMSR